MKKLVVKEIWYGVERYAAPAYRVSRWISIKEWINPTPRCQLWDYVTDGNGENSQSDNFEPSTGTFLDYFKFDGRNYALSQFYQLGSMFIPERIAYTENGAIHYLHGVDMDNIYNPVYIEFNDYGDKVRVYRIGKRREV